MDDHSEQSSIIFIESRSYPSEMIKRILGGVQRGIIMNAGPENLDIIDIDHRASDPCPRARLSSKRRLLSRTKNKTRSRIISNSIKNPKRPLSPPPSTPPDVRGTSQLETPTPPKPGRGPPEP